MRRTQRIAQVGALIAAVAAGLGGAPAAAAVRQVVVPVRGMTCVLCTRGVEESIKRLDGVGVVMADLQTARVQVEAIEGKSLSVQQVREGVQRAGFGIGGEIDILATGRFTLGPDRRITFRVTGTPLIYHVMENAQLLRLSRRHRGFRGDFVLGFRLHDHPYWKPPGIAITSFEIRTLPAPPAATPAGR